MRFEIPEDTLPKDHPARLLWRVAETAEKAHYPMDMLCGALEVSRSGYYAWSKRAPSKRARADVVLSVDIATVHTQSRSTYGSPRVYAELRARGKRVGKKRVERLMRECGLVARQKRRFRRTAASNHDLPIASNGSCGCSRRRRPTRPG
ncbi:MAG: IS3 family transposase [Byssovorax sp.]